MELNLMCSQAILQSHDRTLHWLEYKKSLVYLDKYMQSMQNLMRIKVWYVQREKYT